MNNMNLTRDELLQLKEVLDYYILMDIMDLKDESYMSKMAISIAGRVTFLNNLLGKINSEIEQSNVIS